AELRRLTKFSKRRGAEKLISENYKRAGFRNERYNSLLKYD
ncbi:unnamed protein product, partial [marine sediment metagenome]